MRNSIFNLSSLIFHLQSSIFNLLSVICYLLFVICYLLSVNCYLLSAICYAQPTEEWVARYPGPSNDLYGPFLQVDKFGNSYVAGTHVVNDTINILCVKHNTSGVQQWATLYKYPGEGYFAPTGLALDSTGNAYVISDYSLNSLLPYNGLIVKFDGLSGSTVWAKRHIGEYGWSAFRDIKIDRLNNIYVVGWSDMSHLVIRYNTNGDSVWVRKYHPPSVREVTRACTIDDSLNIIFTGQRIDSFDSLLVAKYSSGGVLRWESTCAYSVNENVGTKITADQNGNLYIGGYTIISGFAVYLTLKYDRNGARQWTAIYDPPGSGNNNFKAISYGRFDNSLYITGQAVVNGTGVAATIKYNPLTGDTIWVKTDVGIYNGGGARDIKLDSNGNVYITGETYYFPTYVPYDILTLKYSLVGNQIWQITYNWIFNGLDIGHSIGLDDLNKVYVLGTSRSSSQIFDYIVIKYSQLLGVSPIANEIPTDFGLRQNYPNPFNSSSKIKFKISKLSAVKITVHDILGREVGNLVNEKLKRGTYEVGIDGTNYPSGIYFYRMIADGNIIDTKKFIVLK